VLSKSKKVSKKVQSKSHMGLTMGHNIERSRDDSRESDMREMRAAAIIARCCRLALWADARRVYDVAAAVGTGNDSSLSSLNLAQIQSETLSLQGGR
jgi:hypothetical protein